jgi:anti-sigma factor RsiW
MRCREVAELITDYLEGALSPADRASFEEHVAGCDSCTAYIAQLRATRRVLGHLAEVEVPPAIEGELLAAFRDWRREA